VGPALLPGRALLPADLLVQFEPWRSQVTARPQAQWDALVWDGIAQYYPWRQFAGESLRAGHLPLWNPYQFCGTPFLANGQSAVLYPLNLLFWLLPTASAFGWSALLHLFLAGWFGYLFLRRMGVGRPGALAGGIGWQLNSFFVAWLHLPTAMCTASWLPLVLLLGERAVTRGRARYAVGAGVALALSYLGGHPQMFMFVGLFTAAYLVARAGALARGQGVRLAAARLVKTGAVAGAFATALSLPQLLSTLDLLRVAHRAFIPGPESYKAFLSRALPAPLLSNLLLPHPFGHPALGTYVGPENYAEYTSYIGIVALAFAIYGALASRTWHARFLAAAAVVAVLVAIGTPLNWPLYQWVPGMSGGGGPARIIVLAVFSLSMLAGVGVDRLVRGTEAAGSARRAGGKRGGAVWPALAILAAVALAAAAWWQTVGAEMSHEQQALGPALNAEAMRALALVGVAVALVLALGRPRLRKAAEVGLLAVLAVDLLLAAQHHAHVVPQQWVYAAGADPGPVAGRVLGNASDWPLNRFPEAVLPPNAAMVYRLRDASGYDSLYLAHYRDFASLIQGGDPSPPLNGNLLMARLSQAYGLDMLSLAGVEQVYSPKPLRGMKLERAGAFDTYENPYRKPRAWVATSSVGVPSNAEAVAALTKLGSFEDLIVITGADEPLPELPPGPRPPAEVRDVSPNEVIVDLPKGGGGYLFLADSYAPGWRAYAEGRELPIRVADVTFRAVALPVRARSVEFRYEPAAFRVGLFAGLAGLAALATALGFMVACKEFRPGK